jgi:hypothetical protein
MTAPTPPAEPSATPPADPTQPPTPPALPATGDGLGDAGRKALDAERTARKELEKQVKDLQARDPVKALLEALGQKPEPGQDPSQALTERIAAMEERTAKAELEALRLKVAADKGLSPKQAARLRGATRDELEADADELLADFPGSTSTPGTPRPDPTQGARGSTNDLQAQLKAAQDKGDVREAIRIKQLLAEQRKPQ